MSRLSYTQIEFMAREMASLVRAGISLPAGLRQLAETTASAQRRELWARMAASLERGHPLSQAMQDAGAPPEFVAALRCAEISGDMAEVLDYAIEHCRRIDLFYGRLANAVLYPVLVIAIAMAVFTVVCMVMVPRFIQIFGELGAQLPATTRSLIGISSVLQAGVGPILILISALLFAWACSPLFIRMMPRMLQRVPFFGELMLLSDLAMLMRFVDRMLGRGIPLPTILGAASLSMWAGNLRRRLQQMAMQAEQGLAVFGRLEGLVPPLPLELLRQAEQRGDLRQSCPGVADYCEQRFQLRAESQVRSTEIFAIVALGLFVGFLVLALYQPLFSIPRLIK